MQNANKYAIMITGKPVATANNTGKYKPDALAMVIGISIPKNKTPLYGQNAKANTTPCKNARHEPLPLFSDFCNF